MSTQFTPRWSSGEHLVIAWPGGVALLEAAVGTRTAEKVWSRLHRDSQIGVFLKTLSEGSASGFLDLPSFAVGVREGQRWHFAVRGAVPVEVEVDGRVEQLSGEGVTTWAERALVNPVAVRFGVPGVNEYGAPVADGVVHAGAVSVGEFTTDLAAQGPGGGEPSEMPEPAEPEPNPAWRGDGGAHPAVLPGDPVPVAAPAVNASVHTTLAEPDESVPVEPAAAPEANPYDSLWDHSIALDVEAAAIRGEIEEIPQAPSALMTNRTPVLASPAPGPQPAADQMSGDTIADEGLVEVAMLAQAGGPQVLARFCDRGHANPPERAVCFVCGADVSGDARMTGRPQLGSLRVEGGESIPLRGPVIAGRNPRSNALKLDETPRLVALPHPHVSSTHLAILTEGWRLLVRDLRSSNGTFLRRQGKPPVRLPEAAVPLVPGDLIDLGKGLFLHLERTP